MKFKVIYLWFALPVVVIIAWVLVFYMPMSARIKAKEREVAALEGEMQRADNDIKNIMEVKKRNEEMKQSFQELETQIPAFEELPEFMGEIVKVAKGEGIVLDKFSSMFASAEMGQKGGLTNPVFEIGLKGRFLQMGRFLERLGDKKAFGGITKARIVYDEKEYPVLTGSFVLEFKAWKEKRYLEGK